MIFHPGRTWGMAAREVMMPWWHVCGCVSRDTGEASNAELVEKEVKGAVST